MFIEVNSTRRDGIPVRHTIAVSDVSGVTTAPKQGGAILTLKDSEYQIWTTETYEQVVALLLEAGGEIAKINPEKESQ